jgi:hypothetical protein
MKTSGQVATFKINKVKLTKTLESALESHFKQALRVWLKSALAQIPTYTGTARGVFVSVGKSLHRAVHKIGPRGGPTNAKRAAQKKYIYYNSRRIETGFGKVAGFHKITKKSYPAFEMEFTFYTDLFYLKFNDYLQAPSKFHLTEPSIWHAFSLGAWDWQQYLLNSVPKRLAEVKNSFRPTIVKVR